MRDFRYPAAKLLAFTALAAVSSAAAQESTTATYGDWVLQCTNDAGPPPKKICDIAQVSQVPGKNIPFSRLSIGRLAKGQPFKLVVQVPVNVSLHSPVEVRTSDADPAILAVFDHCLPIGCFAEVDLKDENLKKFYASQGTGKMSFKDSGGREVSVPVSFNGYPQAYDALSKE